MRISCKKTNKIINNIGDYYKKKMFVNEFLANKYTKQQYINSIKNTFTFFTRVSVDNIL